MKRKRKHKQGKGKGASTAGPKNVDQFDKDDKNDSPSPAATKPLGRIMVKLKTPKVMESQVTSSDAPTQSDIDKSSQQMGLETQDLAADKTEDSDDSLAEANSTKKAGSIKIKSSKVEALPSTKDGSPLQKEQKTRYDKQELDTTLMVIQKVMKMDAVEPFNVPVNPVALGIPSREDCTSRSIKVYVKGGLSKKTSKKGHGRRHKSDCLCVICVLKRRRWEKNARIAQGQIGESSPAEESPSSEENSTSDVGESTANPNAAESDQGKDVKMEESTQSGRPSEENEEDDDNDDHHENEEEEEEKEENDVEMKDKDTGDEPFDKTRADTNKQSLQELAEKSGDGIQSDMAIQHEKPEQKKALEEKPSTIKAHQIKLRENPIIMDLCGTLFPDNSKSSIWSGPHSLVQRHRQSTSRTTSYTSISTQAAIDMLLKQPN